MMMISRSYRCEFHWRACVGDNRSCQWSEMVGDDENKSSTHVLCPRTWSQTPDQTCKTGWVKEDMKIFGSKHLRPENILHLGPSNIQRHLSSSNILHLSPARLRTVPPPSLTVNSSPLPPFLDHQVTRMKLNISTYHKTTTLYLLFGPAEYSSFTEIVKYQSILYPFLFCNLLNTPPPPLARRELTVPPTMSEKLQWEEPWQCPINNFQV